MNNTTEFKTIRRDNHTIMPYKTYGLLIARYLDSGAELRNSIRLERITINHAIKDLRIMCSRSVGSMRRRTTEFNTIKKNKIINYYAI